MSEAAAFHTSTSYPRHTCIGPGALFSIVHTLPRSHVPPPFCPAVMFPLHGMNPEVVLGMAPIEDNVEQAPSEVGLGASWGDGEVKFRQDADQVPEVMLCV